MVLPKFSSSLVSSPVPVGFANARALRGALIFAGVLLAPLLTGCGAGSSSFVKSETALGRVVVYRNGVAYFERTARVTDDTLKLAVPPDKVDDFLKSLTVYDAATGQPAPVSYSSKPGEDGTLEMKIGLPGPGPHDVKLTYVTDAPAWKPSYRVVLGQGGRVNLQSWAIVDNTSGEDWDRVKLGVGSSSALSFRFNLRGIRTVDRQTLRADDIFAQAPPSGGTTYGGGQPKDGKQLFAEFGDEAIALNDRPGVVTESSASTPKRTAPSVSAVQSKVRAKSAPMAEAAPNVAPNKAAEEPMVNGAPTPETAQFRSLVNGLRNSNKQIVIEGFAQSSDSDKSVASLDRANKVRDQLIRAGIDANRVAAVGSGEQKGRNGGVRIVEAPPPSQAPALDKAPPPPPSAPEATDPIGTSHFESGSTMTVVKGSAAMVSIYKGDTPGEVVYYYDSESNRGNAQFPFKAVRFKNPTESQLEQGPVTVFGQGRFIGEGLTEPVPARATAFIPYALDRQIVVERKEAESDEIARILTVSRGVFSSEIKHTKKRTLTFFNRSGEVGTVYVRHTPAVGYKFTSNVPKMDEKVGGAQLFRIEVPANGKVEAVIEEATPILRSTDIRTKVGLDLIRAYVSQGALDPTTKAKVNELIKLNAEMTTYEERLQLVREQQGEYRQRMEELHKQIFTLKAVKTAGPMMQALEKKMVEMSDRVSKATVEIVTLEEKVMVTRVRIQDGISELTMEPTPAPVASK
jgi:hypothetical protein